MNRLSLTRIRMALLFALAIGTATARSASAIAPDATPAASALPDACERNDTPRQACILELERVNGPFTFLPAGDQDFYRIDLGAQPTGQPLEITVRATSGLDLLTTITRDGDTAPLAIIGSPAISTTLAPDLTGLVLLRVENRAAAIPVSESYSIELRRTLPPPAIPGGMPETVEPDALENNWNPATAAPIAIGVVYDLTFACPETWLNACPGGDHDYLRVPVKAGSKYQIVAFDPAPGVDPVVELFWQNMTEPVAANDDAFSGGFAAMLQWTAPANGDLVIRISPRNGDLQALLPENHNQTNLSATTATPGVGNYRFAMVLQQSRLAQQILERVAAAANVTLTPPVANSGTTAANSPAATPTAAVTSDAPTGPAIVSAPDGTALREEPGSGAIIETLIVEQPVMLLGQANGLWVRARSEHGVVPGWVYGPHVRLSAEPALIQANATSYVLPTPSALPAPAHTPDTAQPVSILVAPLPDRPLPPAPVAAPRITLSLRVQLETGASSLPVRATASRATPTRQPATPLAGVRVQLITIFGDVLTEAITPADGIVTLTRDVEPAMALQVRIPAAGIEIPIDPGRQTLTITLPGGIE